MNIGENGGREEKNVKYVIVEEGNWGVCLVVGLRGLFCIKQRGSDVDDGITLPLMARQNPSDSRTAAASGVHKKAVLCELQPACRARKLWDQ